jgi:hypothetical protein
MQFEVLTTAEITNIVFRVVLVVTNQLQDTRCHNPEDHNPKELTCPTVFSFRATENILIRTRTQKSFRCHSFCFCNLLFETNSFGLGAILPSCLVSELQELPSPRLELRALFRNFYLAVFSFLSQEISIPSLVQIGISSRARSGHTYIYTV